MRQSLVDDLARNLDILLSSHEDQDITWRERQVNLQHLLDGAVDVVFAGRFCVEYLDGEGSPWDGEGRCVAIERGELGHADECESYQRGGGCNLPSLRSW